MSIVIATDETTEITVTETALTGIACLTIAPTGTGSLSVAGSGLTTTPGSEIVTGARTITTTMNTTGPGRTGVGSEGDAVIPIASSLIAAEGGRTRVETSGQ